jgi:hypothetical protein
MEVDVSYKGIFTACEMVLPLACGRLEYIPTVAPTSRLRDQRSPVDPFPFTPRKVKGAANLRSLLPWLVSSPSILRQNVAYWLSGLNVRTPASVVEQTPAGQTRTTASSSAQKARRPVWLIVIGTAARLCSRP